jgi:hypothetical protein
MAKARPRIPDPLQREVRQRCGFGCVLCGLPLYEYHHMDGRPQNNDPSNITLLCDKHHKEATNGLLTPEQTAEADSNPYNRQRGVSSPYGLHFEGESVDCVIGGNTFSRRIRHHEHGTVAIAISVDDTDLLWFRIADSGRLFLNATIFDENNFPLLVIHENSLLYRTATWDIEFKGHKLTVRERARKILCEIEFRPPSEIVIERARLLYNGVEVLVRKSHIFIVNLPLVVVGNTSADCDVGLQLGRNCRRLGAGYSYPDICRYHTPATEVRRREQQALKDMEQMFQHLGIPLDPESRT